MDKIVKSELKDKCFDAVQKVREELIEIINNFGVVECLSIKLKRDFGGFTENMVVDSIGNGRIHFQPNELFVNGLYENYDDLSVNEMYDLIMRL